MRTLSSALMAVVAAASLAACSGHAANSSDSSSDNSGGTAASATADSGAASSASAAPAANGELPSYPGATTEASGDSAGTSAGGSASGKVLTTADSFDKVYAWYQKNMPAGSEKSHMSTPIQAAVFMTGEMGKDQQSVSITVAQGKTMITLAHVKS